MNMVQFKKDLEILINMHSMENGSNTPDFILAQYLMQCLEVFDEATNRRAEWYGHADKPASAVLGTGSEQE